MKTKYIERLKALRNLMLQKNWDVVYISSSDSHNSEYTSNRWQIIKWLTGFTGENCKIAVTQYHAGLWTDSRFFIQANDELKDTGFILHKDRIPGSISIYEWIATKGYISVQNSYSTPNQSTSYFNMKIAFDGNCTNSKEIDELKKSFIDSPEGIEDIILINIPDLIDNIWGDRPPIPVSPILTFGDELTGESRLSKIEHIREFLRAKKIDSILISALDEIAWVLNARGNDIEYNPVVISYLLITQQSIKWFVKKSSLKNTDTETKDSFAELISEGIEVLSYYDVEVELNSLVEIENINSLMYDQSSLNFTLNENLKNFSNDFQSSDNPTPRLRLLQEQSPIQVMKACKNETEIEGMKEVHLYDGIAMENFIFWLEKAIQSGAKISETDAMNKIDKLRSEIQGYKGASFKTISAYGRNAALPHYQTPTMEDLGFDNNIGEEKHSLFGIDFSSEDDYNNQYEKHISPTYLEAKGLYLVDSGGQYFFGTTDLTRTIPLGDCSELEKEDYTLVLKGMIDLSLAVFPRGTAGCQIDALARNPLWQSKRNFGHGTGHGVGCYLNVHEGPQDIRQGFNNQAILPGMITSNEPGLYRENEYGIRHENLVLCKKAGENNFGEWLNFETITLCHFDTSIIVKSLLNEDEVKWLNDYNHMVYETLSPYLNTEVQNWLRSKTLPL